MGEHYGCAGWEGAANSTDANHSTGRVKSARWDAQECWQKLETAQPEYIMEPVNLPSLKLQTNTDEICASLIKQKTSATHPTCVKRHDKTDADAF